MYSDYAYSELFYLLYGEKIWHLEFFRFFFQLVMRWLGRWLQRWKDGTKTDNGICRNLVTLKMVTPKLLGTRLHRTTILWCSTFFFWTFLFYFYSWQYTLVMGNSLVTGMRRQVWISDSYDTCFFKNRLFFKKNFFSIF